jgi:hypothetical protein
MNSFESHREAARKAGIPEDIIDWWQGLVRPSAEFYPEGDGPVAGQFGGNPMLPADVEWPKVPIRWRDSLGVSVAVPESWLWYTKAFGRPRGGGAPGPGAVRQLRGRTSRPMPDCSRAAPTPRG